MNSAVFGIMLIVFGILVYINPSPTQYGVPIPRAGGIIVSVFGVIWILRAIFKKDDIKTQGKDVKYQRNDFTICPTCEETFSNRNATDMQEKICPKCHVELETLDGFYERHPEHKHEKEKK
jgi:hypothetical protein